MMSVMREKASGWVVKILIALLVLSFAVWGIGDIFTHAQRDATVAKVGNTKITRGEFQQEYDRKIADLKAAMRGNYNPEFIKSLNLGQQTLSSLVDKTLITKEAEALGLEIGEDALQDAIRTNPNFQNENGRFDLTSFQRALQNAQISEKEFYDGLRLQLKADAMLGAFSSKHLLPDALLSAKLSQTLETRDISLILIPTNAAGNPPTPSEQEIQAMYEETKHLYTESEYRSGQYIDLPFAGVLSSVTVSPEDIARAYQERVEEFRHPEKRGLEQLLYATQADAEKAHEAVVQGKSFTEVARNIAPQNKDLALGERTKNEIPAPARETVFSLAINEYSKPIQSDFGWHIFRVTKIIAEGVRPLEEVKARIETDLRQHAAEESIYRTVNTLTDSLAAGASLENVAKEQGLNVKAISSINKDGMTPDGKKADGLPPYSNFTATLFATDENNQSPVTMADDGSYFVLQTTKIIPERVKSLTEVKPQIIKAWKERSAETTLREKSIALAEALKNENPAAAIKASGLNATLHSINNINRNATQVGALKDPLPPALMDQVFSIATGEATSAIPAGNGGYMIAVVSAVIPPQAQELEKATTERDQLVSSLEQQYQGELYMQYMAHLRDKYRVQLYPDRLPKDLANE